MKQFGEDSAFPSLPPLDHKRAVQCLQHVRALNTQFSRYFGNTLLLPHTCEIISPGVCLFVCLGVFFLAVWTSIFKGLGTLFFSCIHEHRQNLVD
jgi:hypothetical protein